MYNNNNNNNNNMYTAIVTACRDAISLVGMETIKKLSWFGSNKTPLFYPEQKESVQKNDFKNVFKASDVIKKEFLKSPYPGNNLGKLFEEFDNCSLFPPKNIKE